MLCVLCEMFPATIPFLAQLPLNVFICVLMFVHIIKERSFGYKLNIIYFIYLLYLITHIFYGLFNANGYWQYKSLLTNLFCLVLPFFALLFSNPSTTLTILRIWKHILDPQYIYIFLSFFCIGSIHFTLGPAYSLFGIFIFWVPTRWKIILGCILFFMIVGDIGARSQVLKGLFSITLFLGIYYRKYISMFFVYLAHWFFYAIAIILIILGFAGIYNIFSPVSFEGEKIVETNDVYGQDDWADESDLTADTRTMLYVESVASAIEHDYIIFGRSPARGNDTELFIEIAENVNSSYYERDRNELCHLNIFTWLGIVGLVIYSLFYLQASFLALYHSNNVFVKYLAILIAFHWAFGWVEDIINLDMMNVGLWLVIGICLSPQFRYMTDKEFELWFKSIFTSELITPYHRLKLENECIKIQELQSKDILYFDRNE